MRRVAVACSLLATLLSCETSPPAGQPSEESFPSITIGLGARRLALPFGFARCESRDGIDTVRLHGLEPPDDEPLLLLARLDGARVKDAHVWIPRGVLGHAEELPAVQLLAADVPGARTPDCRVESESTARTIACNDATIIPWTEPGPVPDVSFKATFECP